MTSACRLGETGLGIWLTRWDCVERASIEHPVACSSCIGPTKPGDRLGIGIPQLIQSVIK